jgi:hypothetical protein
MLNLCCAPFGEFEKAWLESATRHVRDALEKPMCKFTDYLLHFQDFSCFLPRFCLYRYECVPQAWAASLASNQSALDILIGNGNCCNLVEMMELRRGADR